MPFFCPVCGFIMNVDLRSRVVFCTNRQCSYWYKHTSSNDLRAGGVVVGSV